MAWSLTVEPKARILLVKGAEVITQWMEDILHLKGL